MFSFKYRPYTFEAVATCLILVVYYGPLIFKSHVRAGGILMFSEFSFGKKYICGFLFGFFGSSNRTG